MKEILLDIIKAGAPLSIIAMTFALGLRLAPGQQWGFFKEHPLLMLRSLVVVLVLVPIAALAILLLLKPSLMVVIGLAILAASPAAPFQLPNIAEKGGSLVYLATLHLCLALLALITVPVTLYFLSAALGIQAEVSVFKVAKSVGAMILLPVGLGILIHSFFPTAAEKIGLKLGKVAEIVLYVLAVAVLVKTYELLLKMDLWSHFVVVIFIIVNLAIGHVLGPPNAQERTTLAMESGGRNFGLALSIGVLLFSEEKALPVFIPYIISFVVISGIYLKWRKGSRLNDPANRFDLKIRAV